jgi:hypothetical protein
VNCHTHFFLCLASIGLNIEKCITVQQQRRKARVSQEKRASDNDFAMSSTTVPKTEILFAHRILHFLHEKKSTKKKSM